MFMEFRCQNEENCECQWELENRRFLFSEAQVNVALAKIMQNRGVVPLGNSGQEIRHDVVLCFHIWKKKNPKKMQSYAASLKALSQSRGI